MNKLKQALKVFFEWIISLFKTRYKITVSFNKEYGDTDDKTYISKTLKVS